MFLYTNVISYKAYIYENLISLYYEFTLKYITDEEIHILYEDRGQKSGDYRV
jgi:hypothetical protein